MMERVPIHVAQNMGQSQAESGNTLNNNTYNDPQPNTYNDAQDGIQSSIHNITQDVIQRVQPTQDWTIPAQQSTNCTHPSCPQQWGPVSIVFGAGRPSGPASWLALLLLKASDVETNPGPNHTQKQVWICDICHTEIHRKQPSVRCNHSEHWVHLRCAEIRLDQYTDTWICHLHTPHPKYQLTSNKQDVVGVGRQQQHEIQPTTCNDAQPTTFCSVHGIVNKTPGEEEDKKLVPSKIKSEPFPSTHLEETVHGCHDRKKMVHPPSPAPEMLSSSVSIKLERCDHLLHLQDSKLKLENKLNVKQHCSVHGPLSDNLTMTGVETDYSNYVMDVTDSESKDQMCDAKNGK